MAGNVTDKAKTATDSVPSTDDALAPIDKQKKKMQGMTPDQAATEVLQGKKEGEQESKDGSLRIHIKLDLEVEVHLTARVKGDITIGLLS